MVYVVAVLVAVAWFAVWFGVHIGALDIEIRGLSRRVADAVDRRFARRDSDGLLASAGRGLVAGIVGPVLVFGLFLLPFVVLYIVSQLL